MKNLLTEEEIQQISRLKELHIQFRQGSGLTKAEVREYEELKEELSYILPIDF